MNRRNFLSTAAALALGRGSALAQIRLRLRAASGGSSGGEGDISLNYVGQILIPQTATNQGAGMGLAIRTHPTGGYRELIAMDNSRVYGVRLPSAWNGSEATDYINYGTITMPSFPPNGAELDGLGFDHEGDLLMFYGPFYGQEASSTETIQRFTLSGSALTNQRGPYAVSGVHYHRRRGGCFVLPTDVAGRLTGGKRTVIGFGGYYNTFQNGSMGTAMYAVSDLTNFTSPATIIEFTYANAPLNELRRGDYSDEDPIDGNTIDPVGPGDFQGTFQWDETRVGATWGYGGLWVIGQEPCGPVRYGSEGGESGFHADEWKTTLRYYPESLLQQIVDDDVQPWEAQPQYMRMDEGTGAPTRFHTVNGPNFESRVGGLVIEGDLLIVAGPFSWGPPWYDFPGVYAFQITQAS